MGRLKNESIAKGEGFWELRVGIHTGDVIAGVIGSTIAAGVLIQFAA